VLVECWDLFTRNKRAVAISTPSQYTAISSPRSSKRFDKEIGTTEIGSSEFALLFSKIPASLQSGVSQCLHYARRHHREQHREFTWSV
jgi:hypothetical protein